MVRDENFLPFKVWPEMACMFFLSFNSNLFHFLFVAFISALVSLISVWILTIFLPNWHLKAETKATNFKEMRKDSCGRLLGRWQYCFVVGGFYLAAVSPMVFHSILPLSKSIARHWMSDLCTIHVACLIVFPSFNFFSDCNIASLTYFWF